MTTSHYRIFFSSNPLIRGKHKHTGGKMNQITRPSVIYWTFQSHKQSKPSSKTKITINTVPKAKKEKKKCFLWHKIQRTECIKLWPCQKTGHWIGHAVFILLRVQPGNKCKSPQSLWSRYPNVCPAFERVQPLPPTRSQLLLLVCVHVCSPIHDAYA